MRPYNALLLLLFLAGLAASSVRAMDPFEGDEDDEWFDEDEEEMMMGGARRYVHGLSADK